MSSPGIPATERLHEIIGVTEFIEQEYGAGTQEAYDELVRFERLAVDLSRILDEDLAKRHNPRPEELHVAQFRFRPFLSMGTVLQLDGTRTIYEGPAVPRHDKGQFRVVPHEDDPDVGVLKACYGVALGRQRRYEVALHASQFTILNSMVQSSKAHLN